LTALLLLLLLLCVASAGFVGCQSAPTQTKQDDSDEASMFKGKKKQPQAPALSTAVDADKARQARLTQDLKVLAGQIGERHYIMPEPLEAAASFLEGSLKQMGYAPKRQVYQAKRQEFANIEVEPYWPTLFAKLCKGKNIGDMLSAVGSAPAAGGDGGGAAAAAPAADAAAGAAPAAKAPEPEPVEEEEEMGFDLFGAARVRPMLRALLTRTRGSGSCCALFCWRRRADRMPSRPSSQIKHSFLLVRVPNGCISCEPVVRYDGLFARTGLPAEARSRFLVLVAGRCGRRSACTLDHRRAHQRYGCGLVGARA